MDDSTVLALVKLFGRKGGESGLSSDQWKQLDAWLSLECRARGMADDWMDVYYDHNMLDDDQWTDYYARLGVERRTKTVDGGLKVVSYHGIGTDA